uniref:Uncharacterized protein n=1 Tax=Panagrolaimus sp. PS1159 TaxID=55785 RepID=A0AC35G7W3_9BILA
MIKLLIILSLILLNFTDADTVIASWGNPSSSSSSDYPNSQTGPFAQTSSFNGDESHSFAEFFDRLAGNPKWSSSGSSYNYPSSNTYYNPPIYGNAGYTTGQINGHQRVQGQSPSTYNGYSNNYWTCVNTYRGQYYYSYTYNEYVCDTRANRYG